MTSTPNDPDPIPAISIHRTHPLGDAALIGLRLIGAGLGATGLALIEGFARRGHLPAWAALHPRFRALVLIAHAVVAATLAHGVHRVGSPHTLGQASSSGGAKRASRSSETERPRRATRKE